jgi:hypothetical protein
MALFHVKQGQRAGVFVLAQSGALPGKLWPRWPGRQTLPPRDWYLSGRGVFYFSMVAHMARRWPLGRPGPVLVHRRPRA